jgi:hypothetical protein
MKSMNLITLIGSLVILISGCNTLFPDEKLSMPRMDYTGND